jgi:hypothetical protein
LQESVYELLATHERQGWQSLLVGATASALDRDDVHRSLIGVLALEPGQPGAEQAVASDETRGPDEGATPAAAIIDIFVPPAPEQESPPAPERESLLAHPSGAPASAPSEPPAAHRRPARRFIAAIAVASAAVALYACTITVAPGEVATIRRSGRVVAVCQAGVHLRPFRPFEAVTYTCVEKNRPQVQPAEAWKEVAEPTISQVPPGPPTAPTEPADMATAVTWENSQGFLDSLMIGLPEFPIAVTQSQPAAEDILTPQP